MSILRPILRAGSRFYQRVVQRRLDPHTREIATVLRDVPALSTLSSQALYAMAGVMHRRTYRRGEVLYYEGDPGLGLYVVEEGQVRLVTHDESDQSRELSQLRHGDMTGVLSLMGEVDRLETAEAVTEAQVLGFFRPDLQTVMRRDPTAGGEIVMVLSRHIGARHVEIVQRLRERDGHRAAMDIYAQALQADDAPGSTQP